MSPLKNKNALAWAAACAAVWLWTWRFLANEWRSNEQYEFGFAVPFLMLYLGWSRLPSGSAATPAAPAPTGKTPGRILAASAFALFFLGELLRQQDPTWRLAGWLMGGAGTLLTAGWLIRWGGRPVLRQLAFPLAFGLLALPWPSFIETPVTQKLLYFATGLSTDLLNWVGIAALQHGNVIELSNGLVGIDTACSGIQSFQASFMATLFLGEYFWLSTARRSALVLLGWIAALLGNLGRIFALTILVRNHGEPAFDRFHDRVGAAATAFIFLTIALAAWLFAPKARTERQHDSFTNAWARMAIAGRDGYFILLLLLSVPLLASSWFYVSAGGQLHEQKEPLWIVNTNLSALGWQAKLDEFSPLEKKLLHFSEGTAWNLSDAMGSRAYLIHMFWRPENNVPNLAYSHSPDICLRSAGWQMNRPPDPVALTVHGTLLQGGIYHFQLENEEQSVLQLVWQGGELLPFKGPLASVGKRGSRFALIWSGPRRRGHEVITAYLSAVQPLSSQTQMFQNLLEHTLTKTHPVAVQ